MSAAGYVLVGMDHFALPDNELAVAQREGRLWRNFQGFTTKSSGHGFGLHYCGLAASSLGGSLTVFSDGPGKGATFSLQIPLLPHPPQLTPLLPPPSPLLLLPLLPPLPPLLLLLLLTPELESRGLFRAALASPLVLFLFLFFLLNFVF